MPKQKSDAQIVQLTLDNPEFFEQLVERYELKLTRYIHHLGNFSSETAEDLLQEVFIKVYRNLNDYDQEFSFSSWIYRITHNEVIDYFRKNKSRPQTVSIQNEDKDQDFISLIPDDTDLPSEFAQKELSSRVRNLVFSLPDKYRDVLILRYLEDKGPAEISDILRKSENSVSVLINRAKAKLKEKIKNLKHV